MGCWKSKPEKKSLLPPASLIKGEIDKSLPKQERKLILVGPTGVGKTQFFCSFKNELYEAKMKNTNPDLAISLCYTEFFKSKLNNIIVVLWDSAGSSEYLGITKNFVQGRSFKEGNSRVGWSSFIL